ncbi:MAG: hypothetical protein ACREJC_03510 [Tepidisphaeraceae bacterium]
MPDPVRRISFLFIALLLAAPVSAQQSALTVPRNLAQLVERSAVIVRGNVISARIEKHPELTALDTLVVTLRVQDTMKGTAGDTFTFRQYVWDIRDRISGVGYKKGQDVLLMMIAPSRYGLSSPAGVEQGRFRIERDAAGREYAVNAHNNRQLFQGVGAQMSMAGITPSPAASSLLAKHHSGQVELRELTTLIRQLATGSE